MCKIKISNEKIATGQLPLLSEDGSIDLWQVGASGTRVFSIYFESDHAEGAFPGEDGYTNIFVSVPIKDLGELTEVLAIVFDVNEDDIVFTDVT